MQEHDELHKLALVCSALLSEQKKTLAVAESCTGGMIASALVGIAGCSDWFIEGAVTYSNCAKIRRLRVATETLEEFGAVSRQTALEMAQGIKVTSNADVGISTTGIAGPGGGTEATPVGTVYVGYCDNEKCFAMQLSLNGTREQIRNEASIYALTTLYEAMYKVD